MNGKHIELDTSVLLLWCFLILMVPLRWLFGALFAAAVHELFHAAAIYITGGHIYHFQIGIFGATMETEILSRRAEVFCAAAGPCGSFLLLFLSHSAPRAALCGLVQGVYNLLPIYPLDGGRMLHCILQGISPRYAEQICTAVEFLVILALIVGCLYLSLKLSLGLLPIFAVVFLLVKMRLRKRPCKQRKIRVQ